VPYDTGETERLRHGSARRDLHRCPCRRRRGGYAREDGGATERIGAGGGGGKGACDAMGEDYARNETQS
jgi:hypothetical protein